LRHKRIVILLALGLLNGFTAGPTLAVIGDMSDVPEVRLPVTPPPAPPAGAVRELRTDISPKPTPAAPDFAKSVEIPTDLTLAPPVFTDKDLLGQVDQPPPPPVFPGYSSEGPELRLPVTAPGSAPASPAGTGQPVLAMPAAKGEEQWHLAADRIVGQHGSEYIEAVGGATLVRGLNSLKADFIRYYQASRWVILRGHVRVLWDGDVLDAEEAEFDLSSMQGWLKHGKVFVSRSNVHVDTEFARRYGVSNYRFENAKFTGCEGDTPAWSFSAKEGDIDLEGRTKLYGTKFNVLDQPVAYTPFLSLPGNTRRQSGLLAPEISQSSRKGFSINQAYYWVLDEEHDLTFYENAMSRRGLMQGVEYRSAENSRTKSDWRLDYLNDRMNARDLYQENSNLQTSGLSRSNSNRWWLRSKFDGFVVDPAWTFKLDLDYVSDQDYLREFSGGASGFDSSRQNFLKEFGRDIDVADSLTRTSTAYLARSWEKFGVTAKVAWTENLNYLNGNNPSSKNPTTQSLPELNAFAFKDSLPGTPFDLEAAGRFNYFWREYGTRGVRTDMHPVLSLPMPLGPLTLIPTVGVRNTAYSVGGYANEPATTTTNKTPARTMFELGFTGFTEFSRVFQLTDQRLQALPENVGKSEWGALRHSVEPRLEFAYVPVPQSQQRLPYFDTLDRLTRQNTITYSLTNVFDRRRSSVVAAPGAPGSNSTVPAVNTDYLDFLRLRVEQSFNRDEASRTEDLGTYPKRPFSDIMVESSVRPEKFITFTSRTYYSPYLNRPTEHENSLTLTKERLGEIRFGHDYLHPVHEYTRNRTSDVQVLSMGADYYITDKLKLVSDYRMDIAGHSDLEKSVGLQWRDQCYDVQLKYARKPSDQSIELRFNLLDFGKP
jgi:LPS-assembly protein